MHKDLTDHCQIHIPTFKYFTSGLCQIHIALIITILGSDHGQIHIHPVNTIVRSDHCQIHIHPVNTTVRSDHCQIHIPPVNTILRSDHCQIHIPPIKPALALVDVLGVFTSEIGFRTPKILRSDVL